MAREKQIRVGVLLGSHVGGDDFTYATWVRHLVGLEVHVLSRIDPAVHLDRAAPFRPPWFKPLGEVRTAFDAVREAARSFETVYAQAGFEDGLAHDDVRGVEDWLGLPMYFLASMSHLHQTPGVEGDVRPTDWVARQQARYCIALRHWLQKRRVQVLLMHYEANEIHKAAFFVARRLGIRVVGLMPTRLPVLGIHLMEDFTTPVPIPGNRGDLEELRAWYRKRPDVVRQWDAPRRRRSLLGPLRNGSLHRRFMDAIAAIHPSERALMIPYTVRRDWAKRAGRSMRRQVVRGLVSRPPPGERSVLFPLHYFKDVQMSAREPFVDQWVLIRNLVKSMPAGHVLHVRPHPHLMGEDLDLRRFKRLARAEGIRTIDPSVSPAESYMACDVVVTLNSTLGWEAIVHGKPVVTLGHDFYCRDDVAYVVRDMNELPQALVRALREGPRPEGAVAKLAEEVLAGFIRVENNSLVPMDEEQARVVGQAVSKAVQAMDLDGHQGAAAGSWNVRLSA